MATTDEMAKISEAIQAQVWARINLEASLRRLDELSPHVDAAQEA